MQEGYASELDALSNPRKKPSTAKLDRTGPKLGSSVSVSNWKIW
jgi:hypothetical protein